MVTTLNRARALPETNVARDLNPQSNPATRNLARISPYSYARRMNTRLTIELPEDVVSRLEEMARLEGVSVEEVVAAYASAQARAGVRPQVASILDDLIGEYGELYHRLS